MKELTANTGTNSIRMKLDMKIVESQTQWRIVSKELEAENIKIKSYDNTIISAIGDIKNKRILDYGCGPGVLASVLKRLGADVKVFDISEEMRRLCAQKIGAENVYSKINEIPKNSFDVIVCNLVLCIVDEKEVENISRNIKTLLKATGTAYVGFCNPKIFNVPESVLDFRFQTGSEYEENHTYKKLKKEGNYEILELHRPIEWYQKIFQKVGLRLLKTTFTPEYKFDGRKINDFVILEFARK